MSLGDENQTNEPQAPTASGSWSSLALRLLVLAVLAGVVGGSVLAAGGVPSLETLAARETQLRDLFHERPALILSAAFLVYVLVTGLSIPGATPLSLVYGWLFGFGTAVVLVSFASTAGASLAFLFSRFLLGTWVQSRFGQRLAAFNAAMDREGAFYLFTLRLVPAVPFFVINAVMGLTRIRLRTFWWVSQIGMLPATCIFVWAGASAPSLRTLQEKGAGSILSLNTVLALAALGLFPLAARWIVKRMRRSD